MNEGLSPAQLTKIRDSLNLSVPEGWVILCHLMPAGKKIALSETYTITNVEAPEAKHCMEILASSPNLNEHLGIPTNREGN